MIIIPTNTYKTYVHFSAPQVILPGSNEVSGTVITVTNSLPMTAAKEILHGLQEAAYAAGGIFVRPDCFVPNATYMNLMKV